MDYRHSAMIWSSGRNWQDHVVLDDRPHIDMGPLAGLCAALHFGATNGFDYVHSAACDVLPVADARRFRLSNH
ncbi:MAG: hypothetical protein IPI83_13530 [Sphingomonadales bacterium]|nr:hypothetical protein [Sphingomonadales bacterium]